MRNLCAPCYVRKCYRMETNDTQVYSANVIMELFKAAGLPDGVINMITVDGPTQVI